MLSDVAFLNGPTRTLPLASPRTSALTLKTRSELPATHRGTDELTPGPQPTAAPSGRVPGVHSPPPDKLEVSL